MGLEGALVAIMAGSQIMQGVAARRKGKYAKALAERQALQKEQEAEYQIERSALEKELHERRGKKFKGKQRAAIAAQGGTLEASYLDVLAKTAEDIEFEGLMIEHEGKVGAWRAKTGAGLLREEGEMAQREARLRELGHYMTAGSLLLSQRKFTPKIKTNYRGLPAPFARRISPLGS